MKANTGLPAREAVRASWEIEVSSYSENQESRKFHSKLVADSEMEIRSYV
jgi:hypothetical protein